jgi:glycogen debranching enzyme
MQTILHGKHFAITDDRGDVGHGHEGVFHHDVRYLSRWQLRVGGATPSLLGESHGTHLLRHFVSSSTPAPPSQVERASEQVIVERGRLVAGGYLLERLRLSSVAEDAIEFDVELDAGADFQDIFLVKQAAFSKVGHQTGDVGLSGARRAGESVPAASGEPATRTSIARDAHETIIEATEPFTVREDGVIVWHVQLAPRERWVCAVRVAPDGQPAGAIDFDRDAAAATAELDSWLAGAPQLEGGDDGLRRTWQTSLRDLAALRIPAPDADDPQAMLPAAGMPWFMTSFGRDTLITCLQTMLLGAGRSRAALEFLANRQALADDPEADAEPGKILHEIREGEIAARGYGIYYGTVDATPLWLVLLDEYHSWTRDDEFVQKMRPHALAALAWVREHGASTDDGYVQYERRSSQGLVNQSWKDSWDSQRFHDGRSCEGSIAPVEAQGYAYDARLRTARLARLVWDDAELADELEAEAADFAERVNRDFWIDADESVDANDPRRRGFYALALDGTRRKADSLTSNIGHLLWSGIVPEDRVDDVVAQLVDPSMFNGWGIRTMSDLAAPYNPLAYHNGTVWPHDTSLCIAGLAKVGAWDEAERLSRAMFDASDEFDGRLPEVFAGLPREETTYPVEYPTASRPQAWAAATPILLVAALLGIEPHPTEPRLLVRDGRVPAWLEGVRLTGIEAVGETWDVEVVDGHVSVSPSRAAVPA